MKHRFARVVCAFACLLACRAELLAQSAPQPVQPANQPDGGIGIDRTVPYPVAQVRDAARSALATYRCEAKKEQTDILDCWREGKERITVQLSSKDDGTRVEIRTRKRFMYRFGLGQKEWSTPIFDAMTIALEHTMEPAQGARVRVTSPSRIQQTITGNILMIDEQALTILDGDEQPVRIPRALIARLDVDTGGARRHTLEGFLIGAAVGGGVAVWDGEGYCEFLCFPRKVTVPVFALAFGSIGAAVGSFIGKHKWVEMPLDRVHVSLLPGPSGQGQGLALTFTF